MFHSIVPTIRRACLLAFGVAMLAPVAGCTAFQQIGSHKWLSTSWIDADGSASPVNNVLARWESRVRVTENTQAGGAPLLGLAGRVYLFSDDIKNTVDANGFVLVQMFDLTETRAGAAPRKLAAWQFDPHSLKRLKREDVVGMGYTLFLPWEEFDPAVKKVQLQVGYYPAKGSPHFTSPQMLTLHADDAPPPQIFERQAAPASHQAPAR